MPRHVKQLHSGPMHRGPGWTLNKLALIPALMAFVGLTIFTYPTAASWTTQYHQSKVVNDYEIRVQKAEPAATEQLRLAAEYNEALVSGAQLDANANIARGTGESASLLNYESLLRATESGLMARIRIPKIHVDLPVFHGTSEDSLLAGAGHLQGTSLPVGGLGTRTVITAHRGLADAEMFTNLDKIGVGDTFSLEVFGEILTYKVIRTQVIEPDQNEAIQAVAGEDLATLITCTPLGINSHRILVTGERILPTPLKDVASKGKTSELPFFPWFVFAYAGAVTLILLFVWWMGRPARTAGVTRYGTPRHAQPLQENTKDEESAAWLGEEKN